MAKLNQGENRYYPSRMRTGELHDDFRRLYDHVYALQDKLQEAHGTIEQMQKAHGTLAADIANGPSTTKIQGLNVKAIRPQDGQQLTYVAATGQIEWQ